ncbi:hypothetical protein DF185_21880 [Marinifilum breve]|uniref:Uncharacterized protein n=1 Tax=Marinifilum breve TaxID=2184082 RepID=A0A2V3ZU79_9BACT|nr:MULTISPECIES: hypothetical protein [Marinifilum]PXX95745.1 hypothetical protein DF185_21880 [Marinifilum breve]
MEITKLLTKYHKSIILIIGCIILVFINPFSLKKRSYQGFYRSTYKAEVINKYIDRNTRQELFIRVVNIESRDSFYFHSLNDNEGIYKLVEIGDTLQKVGNSYYVLIKNKSKNLKCFVGENSGSKFVYE